MKVLKYIAPAVAVVAVCVSFALTNKADEPIVIESGQISGVKGVGGVMAYKGIPFAAPPVGNLRWKAPQPAQPWVGLRKCDKFGNDPYQPAPHAQSMWSDEFFIPKTSTLSEDCLYLNVWTAAKSAREKRPVLVWIYGGGFNSGGGDLPLYDGEATANKGIVFVNFNYRVGIFGSFAHPELSKESGYNASGNYGLLDQVAALKWVQKNIAAFGGDPNNVTIAGQSAGSMSVNCLLASPLTKGLFQKAIAESGAYMVSAARGMTTLQQAEQQGERTATTLKATSIADLRKLSSEDVQKQIRGNFGPIVDGYVLPEPIPAIFAAGKQNKVPLLTGWNENEGMLNGALKNADGFKKQETDAYGANAETFFKYYPAGSEEEAVASQYKLSKDISFGIQNFTLANVESEKTKVYMYRFVHRVPGVGEYAKYGAFHSGEVAYAYDNLKYLDRPWQPVDRELAKTISSYWANFIISGNPNGKGLPNWPTYMANESKVMILGDKPEAMPMPDKGALELVLGNMKR